MSLIRHLCRISVLPSYLQSTKVYFGSLRSFSCSLNRNALNRDDRKKDMYRPLKLMSVGIPRVWPNAIHSLKNKYFEFLIRTFYDPTFNIPDVIKGAAQAVAHVSGLLYKGDFDQLEQEGLVEPEVLKQVKENYSYLSKSQCESLQVRLAELRLRFIYQIGMIFDDESDRKYVEVMTVFHGVRGVISNEDALTRTSEYIKENLYICNYRFIKEITKGVEGDWKINHLNHFLARELRARF